ncbi:MAG: TSCPD domain-containing protein [Candidatus Hadarchaeales archaeon]
MWTRPTVLSGYTFRLNSEEGKVYVTINVNDGNPKEVFVHVGKGGSTVNTLTEALGRVISVSLQHGIPPQVIIEQLRGIKVGEIYVQADGGKTTSIPDAIAYALEKVIGDDSRKFTEDMIDAFLEDKVPLSKEI